jgi:uncharacterized protein
MHTVSSSMVRQEAPARQGLIASHPLIAYFVLALAITWLVFGPVALGQNGLGLLPYTLPDGAVLLMFIAGAYGPLMAAVIVTRATGGRVRELFKRVVQWRVGVIWYLVALFAMLVIWVVGYSAALDGLPLRLIAQNLPMAAGLFVSNVVAGLILPSLGEEPGWRGFALPRLQQRFHPVVAALILGVVHSVWHLPAIAVPSLLGPLTLENFAAFTLTAAAATSVYVWVYNHSRGSILTAIVLHAASNAASSMLTNLFLANNVPLDALPIPYRWLNVIAFGVAAVVLTIATRGRLGYQRDTAE